jgi:glutathione synthase/RimK-type ligase-like ATP-grasp enzyme
MAGQAWAPKTCAWRHRGARPLAIGAYLYVVMRLAFVTYRALPQLTDDDRLAVAELRHHGATVESAVWDSPLVDWGRYDALVLRSVWDYTARAEAFEAWLAQVEQLGIPLWNPPPLVRWNMDKRYLVDLSERGVTTIPTVIVEQGSALSLEEVVVETGWDELVYKPSISASAFATARVPAASRRAHEAPFAQLVAERDMLVQPFLADVLAEGEWSLLFFGGQFSHAVKKRSRAGDFRVQREFGGTLAAEAPRPALIQAAQAIVDLLPAPWLYARVDGCESDGAFVLMELELIEPDLFLALHPSAPRRFAASLRQLVAGRRTPVAFTPRSVTPPGGTGKG